MSFDNTLPIYWGWSIKQDGSMKNQPDRQRQFFSRLGLGELTIISPVLEHGITVLTADDQTAANIGVGDALISRRRDYILTVTVADCLPVYFYDWRQQAIAIVHAGWRNIVTGILAQVVRALSNTYQSRPQDLLAFIGPHIRPCHFQVTPDVARQFLAEEVISDQGRLCVDLSAAAGRQLRELNLSAGNISTHPDCTYCRSDLYFSWRRDRPSSVEAMVAYIALK